MTPPENYIGRVSGKLTGSEVMFTLRNISKEDGRLYGCKVSYTKDGNDQPSFDSVTLVVEGMNINYWFVVNSCSRFIFPLVKRLR